MHLPREEKTEALVVVAVVHRGLHKVEKFENI